MATNTEDEAQHGARREGGFDDRRKDEVSTTRPGRVDPKRDRSPAEQDEKKAAEERGEGGRLPGRQD